MINIFSYGGAILRRLPVPLRKLIWQVVDARCNPSEYDARYNINQLQQIETVLNKHSYSICNFDSILDFGCGVGRLASHLPDMAPKASIFGVDIDQYSIDKCSWKCPYGNFMLNGLVPPLPVGLPLFDFILSYSVFTHLSECDHRKWLQELGSKLMPGGVMIHTIHSAEYVKTVDKFSPQKLTKAKLGCSVEEFIRTNSGYHYVLQDESDPYSGLTIITKEYITDNWAEFSGLDLIDYVDAAIQAYPEGCQDIVMLRKPS